MYLMSFLLVGAAIFFGIFDGKEAKFTFPNPEVKKELKRFKFIKLDITKYNDEDKKIMKHFKIFGAPNVLLFNSNGKALDDKFIQGFIKPEKFSKLLKEIK